MSDLTTYTPAPEYSRGPDVETGWALVLVFCVAEPHRVGEVAFLPSQGVLGRHGTLPWIRHRPQGSEETGPMCDRQLSRVHLRFTLSGSRPLVENAGRQPLRLNRLPVEAAPLSEGDLLEVGERLVLMVQRRPKAMPEIRSAHAFGGPDGFGIVGESVAAWQLRKDMAFVGQRGVHALIVGASGTGKELAARGLHALSTRARGPWVARSSATIPPTLADAELFGNCEHYPNSGAPARPGLVGAADGGTLFLDEIGKLPPEVQIRLLRVLDDGEYTRLGEAKPRKADLRFLGATNRPPDTLEHDVRARFRLLVEVPSLDARREDIPLIASHLVRLIAKEDPALASRFAPDGNPRLSSELVVSLLSRSWTTNVRELDALLWRSIAESRGEELVRPAEAAPLPQPAPMELSPEVIQACLDRHDGRQEPAWRELGLSSRHVMTRLVRKHNLRVRGRMRSEE